MSIYKICAGVLATIALITGIVLAIPQSRAIIYNTVAPHSSVYEQQQNQNQELQNQNTIVSNEIINLQNQKAALEDTIETMGNDSITDKQLIEDYINEVDELNRQIQMLQGIQANVNNGSIYYMGSYNAVMYWVFDDNDNAIYQNQNSGTHYYENYLAGETVISEIDRYLSESDLMNKSLTLNADTILYGYNVYQIVIGPYGIMWDQYSGEYRFAADTIMDLNFTFNNENISVDDLRNSIENYNQYIVVIDYSYSLNADGLISDITCNFKVTSN